MRSEELKHLAALIDAPIATLRKLAGVSPSDPILQRGDLVVKVLTERCALTTVTGYDEAEMEGQEYHTLRDTARSIRRA